MREEKYLLVVPLNADTYLLTHGEILYQPSAGDDSALQDAPVQLYLQKYSTRDQAPSLISSPSEDTLDRADVGNGESETHVNDGGRSLSLYPGSLLMVSNARDGIVSGLRVNEGMI